MNNDVKFVILGLGNDNDTYYLICWSVNNFMDKIRQNFGLKEKDFHITLGFNNTDTYDKTKDITTITTIDCNIIEKIIENIGDKPFEKNITTLKYLNHRYPLNKNILKYLTNEFTKFAKWNKAYEYAKLLMETYPTDIIGYYLTLSISQKISTFDLNELKNIKLNIIKCDKIDDLKIGHKIIKIINDVSIKYSEKNNILELLDLAYNFELVKFISVDETKFELMEKIVEQNIIGKNYVKNFVLKLNNLIIEKNTNFNKNINIFLQKEKQIYTLCELPSNFSNVINDENKLYGSGIIMPNHIDGIKSLGISVIINLIGENKPSEEIEKLCEQNKIKLYWKGFTDRTACEMKMFEEIMEIITNENNICLVHCLGGIGRTNMFLSGYLMKQYKIPPSNAIAILKTKRKVIMVSEQIFFLKKYYSIIIDVDEKIVQSQQQIQGLLLFVGLPCSGKSTLAMEIYTKYSNIYENVLHLNQDEIGKNECERILSENAKTANLIILDRCNILQQDRVYWIKMYRELVGSTKKIYIIFLNLGLETSLDRLKNRKNHLTLIGGIGGEKIIEDMNKKITIPTKEEGYDILFEINNLDDLNEFKNKIGLKTCDLNKIIKFPRTKHIANLGAMTRDDLLMDKNDIEIMLKNNIVVEEKIDGANLGIRYDENKKIIVQNRSHYVCSSSHAQFKKLDQWILNNKKDLDNILSNGNFIIYGEWLYSKHSIYYTNLPDYFIVFDIYDIDKNKFYSRERIEKIIEKTRLNLIKIIYKGKITLEKLKTLTQSKSQYYDGIVEGIYVRMNNVDWLEIRGKIVRADFISGDEHWTKGKIIQNMLKY